MINKTNYRRYIDDNRQRFAKWKGRRIGDGTILVDLQSRDPFFVSCILKISASVREKLGYGLLVIHANDIPADVKEIVESYYPVAAPNIGRVALKGAFRGAVGALCDTARIGTGQRLVDYRYDGMPVGMHIYDGILRRQVRPFLAALQPKHRAMVLAELCFMRGLLALIRNHRVKYMILPDNAYRCGIAYEIAKARVIPSLVGINLNGMSMHRYEDADDYHHHCRTPDRSVVDALERMPDIIRKADDYLTCRTSAGLQQHDVVRAYASDKRNVTRSELNRMYGFDPHKKLVLVASHIFCDAPHAYPGMLFRDYREWLVETCRRLRENPHVNVIVKEHPSAGLYGEEGRIQGMLREVGMEENLLSTDINTKSLFECVDVLVTCGGTAGMEFPCYGVPVVVGARPPYAYEPYVVRSATRQQYFQNLDAIHTIDRLSHDKIRRAKAVLYAIQKVLGVERGALGLGTQAFYMGCEIDYEKHYAEMIARGENTSNLDDVIHMLLEGQYRNLMDRSVCDLDMPLGCVARNAQGV